MFATLCDCRAQRRPPPVIVVGPRPGERLHRRRPHGRRHGRALELPRRSLAPQEDAAGRPGPNGKQSSPSLKPETQVLRLHTLTQVIQVIDCVFLIPEPCDGRSHFPRSRLSVRSRWNIVERQQRWWGRWRRGVRRQTRRAQVRPRAPQGFQRKCWDGRRPCHGCYWCSLTYILLFFRCLSVSLWMRIWTESCQYRNNQRKRSKPSLILALDNFLNLLSVLVRG